MCRWQDGIGREGVSTMTNRNPNITSSAGSTSFTENANSTGSSVLRTASGTMNFTDANLNDTHTTSAVLKSASVSGGTAIPAAVLADLQAAMASSIVSDSNGSGKLKWTFSTADSSFDFLAKNQTMVLTYEITLRDNHGGVTKKNVTVTITGTDDAPVIQFGAEAFLSERVGETLSFAPDTAQIAVQFTDPDLANTGHTAHVIDVSASGATQGILPGFLGELELRSFFHINNVVKANGSSTGTINTTFSAPDLAFDYLSKGEAIEIIYTIKLNDNAGMNTTQTVVVTVVGTNDGVCIIGGPECRNLTEGENLSPAGDLTAHGDFHFTDIDLSDAHTVSTSVTATRTGGGVVPLTEAELLAALSTSLDDSTGHIFGEVDWDFALDNGDVSFLNSGEYLIITYEITVSDGEGGTDTEVVTIKILGTNDPVVITSGPQSASLAEFADTTGSAAQNSTTPVPTGAIAFTDTDVGDTHTVGIAVASAVWSGGPAIPAATDAGLGTGLQTTLNDSTGTGTGSIDWTFSITDQDLDFLAFGETLTVTYDVTVSDGPTDATQTVTVTIDGANDAVLMTGGPGAASLAEFADTNGSTAQNSTSPVPTGSLTFADVDLNDSHSVSATVASAFLSNNPEFALPFSLTDALNSALATALNDSAGSGLGSIDWTFSVEDRVLDFLGAADTLVVTYDVTVSDGFTSSTQIVTITVTGAEDPLTVNPATGTLADTVFTDDGVTAAFGNVINDAGSNGGDATVTLEVTDVNGLASNVNNVVAGTYGTLFLAANGSYSYVANAALDPLVDGDVFEDQFTFTITDSLNRTETTTLTFTVTGTNDAPRITSAVAAGSVTEDLGPTVSFNGGFETGDFSGWSTTGPHIIVQPIGFGGELGSYTVQMSPTALDETLSQNVATTPGENYVVSFLVTGDAEGSDNFLSVTWDGVTILARADDFSGGFVRYSFNVTANPFNSFTELAFTYNADGTGFFLDQILVEPESGPATANAGGSIAFADVETADTHAASFFEQGVGYVGTFTLDPVSESSGAGSVAWHFTVENADIQFLGLGETLTQTYSVFVTDDGGASVAQDVTISINGTNDAPTTVAADNLITNAGAGGGFFIPYWALTQNDSDTDVNDPLTVNSITSETGVTTFQFGSVLVFEDGTLGGSFDYTTTDGSLASPGSGTVTIDNHTASTTALTGTSGDDIIVTQNAGDSMDGGDGDDILIAVADGVTMTGGDGSDIFAIQTVIGVPVEITDFFGDTLAISASAFGAGLTPGVAPTFESTPDAEFFGSTFHYDTTTSTLYFSADGTTPSAMAIAHFQNGVFLNANDLMIV
jgi:VCBS repeat-containing protein